MSVRPNYAGALHRHVRGLPQMHFVGTLYLDVLRKFLCHLCFSEEGMLEEELREITLSRSVHSA